MVAEFNAERTARRLRMRHFQLLSLLGVHGTVRAAAREMALSQPAVSKMLQEIEYSFGTVLFGRSPRGVTPTPAGQRLISRATYFLNELIATANEVEAVAKGHVAILRVGTFSVIPRVPQAIAELRKRIPEIMIRVLAGTGVDLLDALADGEIDCIVAALPPELLQSDNIAMLSVDTIAEDRLCIVASPSHALANASELHWSQLADMNWTLPNMDSLLRRAIIDIHLRSKLPTPEPVVEILSPVSIAELLVLDPSLLGVMRTEQALVECNSGRLIEIPVHPHVPLPPLAFITTRGSGVNPSLIAEFRSSLSYKMGQQ